MANVIVDKTKLDYLANAISAKSGEPLTLTLDEMVEAVDGIETGGGEPNLQAKTLTVSSAGTETVTADAGYDGLSEVEVSVPQGNPVVGYNSPSFYTSSGQRRWKIQTYCDFPDGEGYGWMGSPLNGSTYTIDAIPTGTTITPSTSSQTIGGANMMMEGAVTVNPIPSQYIIPSGTKTINSVGTTDVTNYASVSVPQADPWLEITSEYYTSGNQRMWRAIPRVLVDVSEGDTAGFIADGYSKSGEDPLTKNAVASGTTITPSTSAQTVGGSDWVMEGAVTVSAMPTGTARPASSITATSATISTSAGTITLTKTNVSSTPQVTAGYISSGTQGTSTVTLSAPVTLQAAATYYPSTSDQTITSPKYLTGTQTIKAVTYANITAENIKNGVTVTIGDSSDADRVLSVTGTYEGGGGSGKNVQMVLARYETNSSSYTATSATITVSKAGTYKCSWTMDRNTTSGTNGTRLYKGTTAQGTAHTTWTHNGSFCQETLTCAANDKLTIYARARSTSYYVGVGNFIIEEQ